MRQHALARALMFGFRRDSSAPQPATRVRSGSSYFLFLTCPRRRKPLAQMFVGFFVFLEKYLQWAIETQTWTLHGTWNVIRPEMEGHAISKGQKTGSNKHLPNVAQGFAICFPQNLQATHKLDQHFNLFEQFFASLLWVNLIQLNKFGPRIEQICEHASLVWTLQYSTVAGCLCLWHRFILNMDKLHKNPFN